MADNANAVLTINTYPGGYNHQIGFNNWGETYERHNNGTWYKMFSERNLNRIDADFKARKIGIGTPNPQAGLHVITTDNSTGMNIAAILGNNYNDWTLFGGTTSGGIRGSNEGYLVLQSNPSGSGDKRLYLNPSSSGDVAIASGGGNVGIGCFPAYKLDVKGTLGIYGTGLDGTSYQRALIYSDLHNGLYFDAPKKSDGTGLPINFAWRGNTPKISFMPSGDIGATGNIFATSFIGDGSQLTGVSATQVGQENTNIYGYGTPLNFLGASTNTDPLWIARYNNGDNNSELRVNIGDDFPAPDDKFVIGVTNSSGTWHPTFTVQNNGNVGIGTTSPDFKLDVVGSIRAWSIKINTKKTADFVFDADYKLPSLTEVESYIAKNKHLIDIPSAMDMEKNGLEVGDFQVTLLKKIEELTIYSIQLKKENEAQKVIWKTRQKLIMICCSSFWR